MTFYLCTKLRITNLEFRNNKHTIYKFRVWIKTPFYTISKPFEETLSYSWTYFTVSVTKWNKCNEINKLGSIFLNEDWFKEEDVNHCLSSFKNLYMLNAYKKYLQYLLRRSLKTVNASNWDMVQYQILNHYLNKNDRKF